MARGIWKGTLGFGLVAIGVELFPMEQAERLDLDLLDRRDMAPIGYRKINKRTGKPVEPGDIVRGFQIAKGRYVVLSDDELKAAAPKATQTIEIMGFVDAADIPPLFYDTPYLLAPLKGSERAYVLFREVLERTGRVALGQLVVRVRQYVASVYPWNDAIVVQLLRYQSALRPPDDLLAAPLPTSRRAIKPAEKAMAERLVESMATAWTPDEYRDTYRDDLVKLIRKRGKKGGRAAAREVPSPSDEPKVLDLMAALKRSVAGRTPPRTRRAAQKRARRSA